MVIICKISERNILYQNLLLHSFVNENTGKWFYIIYIWLWCVPLIVWPTSLSLSYWKLAKFSFLGQAVWWVLENVCFKHRQGNAFFSCLLWLSGLFNRQARESSFLYSVLYVCTWTGLEDHLHQILELNKWNLRILTLLSVYLVKDCAYYPRRGGRDRVEMARVTRMSHNGASHHNFVKWFKEDRVDSGFNRSVAKAVEYSYIGFGL